MFEVVSIARGEVKMRRWDLTFDMSGGPKGAKQPLERPLDGRLGVIVFTLALWLEDLFSAIFCAKLE